MITDFTKQTKFYQYYNANPKGLETGDCSVRCLATALNISWDEAVDLACAVAHETKIEPFGRKMVEIVLERNGFTPMKIKLEKGKRPTMKTLLPKYDGYIIVGRIAHHVMCAKCGKVKDIWNSSERPLYKYWIKKEI